MTTSDSLSQNTHTHSVLPTLFSNTEEKMFYVNVKDFRENTSVFN